MASAWWDPWARLVGPEWMAAYNAFEADDLWGRAQGRVVQDVSAFSAALSEARATLDRVKPLLRTDTDRANWDAHDQRWRRLAAPLFADAADDEPRVGNVVVIALAVSIAGISLALGIWGMAWAVAHVSDGVVGAKAVDLWARDLDARRWAAEHGTSLEPSTLPGTVPDPTRPAPLLNYQDNDPGDDATGSAGWLLGALALAAAGGAAWAWSSSSKR